MASSELTSSELRCKAKPHLMFPIPNGARLEKTTPLFQTLAREEQPLVAQNIMALRKWRNGLDHKDSKFIMRRNLQVSP